MSIIFYRLLLLPIIIPSLVIHEYAHGKVAQWLGDPTAKLSGRLTLNPLAHLDPLGLLLLIFSGFGFARPVPINPYYFKNPRWGQALVGLAGPGANLILAWLISLVFFKFFGWQYGLLAELTQLAIWLNCALAIFNLLPIPPLDGSHLLAAILPEDAASALQQIGPLGFLVLIFLIFTPASSGLIVSAVGFLYNLIVSFP